MKKKHHLRARGDFQLIFKTGKRIESPLFTCIVCRNKLSYPRFGFVVSRAVHKRAVVRNRIRRRSREWLWKHEQDFQTTVDLVFIFKKPAADASRRILYGELEKTILFARRIF